MEFHFTKAGKKKAQLKKELIQHSAAIQQNVTYLTVYHTNKKNRAKWMRNCFNELNSLEQLKPGKSMKAKDIMGALTEDVSDIKDNFKSRLTDFPNPSDASVEDALTAYAAYITWLSDALSAANGESLKRDAVFAMLEEATTLK